MLTPFQLRWGIDQWVAYLKDKEIPVLPETRVRLAALREEQQDLLRIVIHEGRNRQVRRMCEAISGCVRAVL